MQSNAKYRVQLGPLYSCHGNKIYVGSTRIEKLEAVVTHLATTGTNPSWRVRKPFVKFSGSGKCKTGGSHLNTEGLQSKLEDPILHRDIYKYDIIVLLETWLPRGFQVKFPGFYNSYSIYRPKNPKAKRCSGGITILVKYPLRKGIKFLPCCSNFFVLV